MCGGVALTATTGERPIGYYCPQTGTRTEIVPCPEGTYGTQTMATSAAQCATCNAKYFCMGGLAQPIPCPPGTKCLAGASEPTECADGEFQSAVGEDSCTTCTGIADVYCLEGSEYPTSCPDGAECANVAVAPVECTAGQYNEGGGTCVDCPAGHYCPAGSISPTQCPPGTYRTATLGEEVANCTNCPAGYSCPTAGLTSAA